jgi:hypothetical protein
MKYLEDYEHFVSVYQYIGWSLELQDWEFIDKTHSLEGKGSNL